VVSLILFRYPFAGENHLEIGECHTRSKSRRKDIREDKYGGAFGGFGYFGSFIGKELIKLGSAAGWSVIRFRKCFTDGILKFIFITGHPKLVHDGIILKSTSEGGEKGQIVFGLLVSQKKKNKANVFIAVLAFKSQPGWASPDRKGVWPFHRYPGMGQGNSFPNITGKRFFSFHQFFENFFSAGRGG
jgi:hypothetical protein